MADMKALPASSNPEHQNVPAITGYDVARHKPMDSNDAPQGGLLEYWRILRRRKGTLILIAALGTLAGILISVPQTPIYQARTSIEVQDMNADFLNIRQTTPVSESTGTMSLTDIQTQIKILQSETLSERTLDKLKVKKGGEADDPTRVSAWRKALNLPDADSDSERGLALKMAAKTLKVRAAGQTRIIEILSDSPDPRMAADFNNTLTNEYIEQNMEARWKMSERTGVWLTRQLDDMLVKLERSEDALQKYARQAGLMFTSDKNSVAEEKLRQMQQELGKAQGDRVAKQSRYELASRASAESLPDVLNDVSLREYQVKLTDLRRQRSELITVYTANQSKVRRVDAEIETLEAALQRERGAIVKRIKNEYDEAMQRENLLTVDYAKQTHLVTDQSEKSIQYNILKREVDSNRQLYDAMLQKMKEASIASAMRASNVRVVDAAKAPKRPYKPNIPTNAGLGLMSGLFLGISYIVMRERANRMIQDPGDATFYLNLAELGAIPSAGMENRRRFPYFQRKELGPAKSGGGVEPPVERSRVELATWQQKPSVMAESFRAVLTSILFSRQNGARPKVLVMTSAGPKEGKTTTICNLGIAMTELKKKVLLVDADMRRPRLHEIFDVENESGLSDVLKDGLKDGQIPEGMIQESKIPGLFILPSGAATSSAANLLHSSAMEELLGRVSGEFDMVLIDTPPMLQLPDARVVARLGDGVILVVRSGHTTRDAALAARQRFGDDNTEITGVILNDWNPKASANGYYGYYDGYYYNTYRYYSKKDKEEISA